MNINFVAANVPLTKNLITGESYPHVSNVTSFKATVNTLDELYNQLTMHANHGHALLTGQLQRDLVCESRAGLIDKGPTQLFILDVDSESLPFSSRDELVSTLGLDGDYIFQHSARSPNPESLRGHYFFLMNEAVSTEEIKNTLKYLNLEHCYPYVTLSSSTRGLHWPIDVVVNDNGRLIYIAPPVIENDPLPERILKPTGNKLLSLEVYKDPVDIYQHLNLLREDVGMEVLAENVVTPIKPGEITAQIVRESEGFLYLNLNGGDSEAYYVHKNNPDFIWNFKDEPLLPLKEVDRSIWESLRIVPPSGGEILRMEEGEIIRRDVMSFRDPESDLYAQIIYDPTSNEVDEYYLTSNKQRVNDFLGSRGVKPPKYIHDGKLVFDPTTDRKFDPTRRWLNTFKQTEYMTMEETHDSMPFYIDKLIRHITVDDECYEHFLNWIAYIWQYRKKTGTAWLFHGHTGTGKGTLFETVLRPMFGKDHTYIGLVDYALDTYNDHMARNLILFLDEVKITDLGDNKVFNKLKNYITEPTLTIRGMRAKQITVTNYSNMILATNEHNPIKIDETERRLNIPPRQEKPLEGLYDFRHLIEGELPQFAAFLKGYKVDEKKARTIIYGKGRTEAIKISQSSLDDFFNAIKTGDLDFFTDHIHDVPPLDDLLAYKQYETIVQDWMDTKDQEIKVPTQTIFKVYKHLFGNSKHSEVKFSALCRHFGLDVKRRVVNDRKLNCITVTFKGDTVDLSEAVDEISNVVAIR